MSTPREQILAEVRRSVARAPRIEAKAAPVRPAVEGDLVERFIARLQKAGGTADRVSAPGDVPRFVAGYLDGSGLARRLVASADPILRNAHWPADFSLEHRAANREDRASLTGVFSAVAETGSLVLLSGPETPTTLNFLPETHIAIVRASQIVRHMEDVWPLVRKQHRQPPRTVNFITGPSRTADVEQTIQVGAHGPRRLHVLVLRQGPIDGISKARSG